MAVQPVTCTSAWRLSTYDQQVTNDCQQKQSNCRHCQHQSPRCRSRSFSSTALHHEAACNRMPAHFSDTVTSSIYLLCAGRCRCIHESRQGRHLQPPLPLPVVAHRWCSASQRAVTPPAASTCAVHCLCLHLLAATVICNQLQAGSCPAICCQFCNCFGSGCC